MRTKSSLGYEKRESGNLDVDGRLIFTLVCKDKGVPRQAEVAQGVPVG